MGSYSINDEPKSKKSKRKLDDIETTQENIEPEKKQKKKKHKHKETISEHDTITSMDTTSTSTDTTSTDTTSASTSTNNTHPIPDASTTSTSSTSISAPTVTPKLSKKQKKKQRKKAKHIKDALARKRGELPESSEKKSAAEWNAAEQKESTETSTSDNTSTSTTSTPSTTTTTTTPAVVAPPKDISAALDYLKLWKIARPTWKFQKVRQVQILRHLYDRNVLPKSSFKIALEYMDEMKGQSRQNTLNEAQKIVQEFQVKKQAGTYTKEEKRKYQRATKIVETLIQ